MTAAYSAASVAPAARTLPMSKSTAMAQSGASQDPFANILSFLSAAALGQGYGGASQMAGAAADMVNSPLPVEKNSLQDFLDGFKNGQNGALSGNILLALTPGTPQMTATMAGGSDELASFLNMSPDQMRAYLNQLSARQAGGDATNMLLIAAPTNPADMERFMQDLRDGLATLQGQAGNSANGAQSSLPVVLVQYLPGEQAGGHQEGPADSGLALWGVQSQSLDDAAQDDQDADFDPTLYVIPINFMAYQQTLGSTTGDQDGAGLTGMAQNIRSIFAQGDGDGFVMKPFEVSQQSALNGELDGELDGDAESAAKGGVGKNGSLINSTLDQNARYGHHLTGGAKFLDLLQNDGGQIIGTGNDALYSGAASGAIGGVNMAQSALANPILQNHAAASAHAATQTVQAALQNNIQDGKIKNQQLSLELDPPELGRVQVFLSYEKGENLKVHVSAEHSSSLEILRRDSHALVESLQRAGIKTDGSSLSFDMSQQGGGFGQAMFGQNQQNHQSSNYRNFSLESGGIDGGAADVTQVSLPVLGDHPHVITDGATGTERYNIVV